MAEADSGLSIAAEPGARRCRRGDRDRRAVRLRGLLPDPARARARPHEPVRDRPDHPEHGRGLGLDGARRAGPARGRVHRACAASNMAIGDGLDAIRLGRADVMFCGGDRGADHPRRHRRASPPCERCRDGTTTRKAASRPFDSGRDGFVMGEAAGMLVLEELEHARDARREDLRRSARLRGLVGCEPCLRSGSDRCESRLARCGWRSPTRGSIRRTSAT